MKKKKVTSRMPEANLLKQYKAEVSDIPERFIDKDFHNFNSENFDKTKFNKMKNFKKGLVLLFGNVGSGKTLSGICMLKNIPPIIIYKNKTPELYDQCYPQTMYPTCYVSDEYLIFRAICKFITSSEFINNCRKSNMGDLQDKHRRTLYLYDYIKYLNDFNCVLVDDFGVGKNSEFALDVLYQLIDLRYRNNKSLILTTNLTIDEINELEPRIASRFAEDGLLINFTADDYRLKTTK